MRFPTPLTEQQSQLLIEAESLMCSRIIAGKELKDPSAAGRMFQYRLGTHDREVLAVAFLSTRHKIIAVEDMFAGTIDGCSVEPREIARRALQLNSAAIMLAHCHPSGCLDPSFSDKNLTQRVKAGLIFLDIRLLDHFVVSPNGYTSMAALGWV